MTRIHIAAIASAVLVLSARGVAQSQTKEPAGGRLSLAAGAVEPARLPLSILGAKPEERPKGPTEITARDAMFDNRIHLGTFSGDVVVKDPEFGLSCGNLSVYLKKPAEKGAAKAVPKDPAEASSGIEKAVAEGDVIITQDKKDAQGKPQQYAAKARRAVFDNTAGTLTLSGWPQISQSIGGNLSKQTVAQEESCVITLDRVGRITVNGYSTSRILDASELNQKPR